MALAALAAAPWTWLPAVAGAAARHWLDLGEKGSSQVRVRVLSPFRLSAEGVSLGALPGAPRIGSVEARYTPWGLARGRMRKAVAEDLVWDLSGLVPEKAASLFAGSNATGRLRLAWKPGMGYDGRFEADVMGAPLVAAFSSDAALRQFDLRARLEPAGGAAHRLPVFRLEAEGERHEGAAGTTNAFTAAARLAADGVPLVANATAAAGDGAFSCEAEVPAAAFASDDPLLAPVLAAFLPPDAPAFSLSGTFSAEMSASRPKGAALPEWTAGARVADCGVSAAVGEKTAAVAGAGGTFRVRGLGPHVDVLPFSARFAGASFDRYGLSKGALRFRADPGSILLTEGFAGFCGGTVRVYALHLDFEKLDAGFTLLLDDLDAGEVLALFPNVEGTATGKMNGKLPLSIRRGAKVRLRDAFLHSPPGQIGKLRLRKATALVDNLRGTGIPEETCRSLEDALADLDYDVLRLDLSQDRETGAGRLALRLHGTAAASGGRAATPVDLNVNLNGQLEESINVGLRAAGLQPR